MGALPGVAGGAKAAPNACLDPPLFPGIERHRGQAVTLAETSTCGVEMGMAAAKTASTMEKMVGRGCAAAPFSTRRFWLRRSCFGGGARVLSARSWRLSPRSGFLPWWREFPPWDWACVVRTDSDSSPRFPESEPPIWLPAALLWLRRLALDEQEWRQCPCPLLVTLALPLNRQLVHGLARLPGLHRGRGARGRNPPALPSPDCIRLPGRARVA